MSRVDYGKKTGGSTPRTGEGFETPGLSGIYAQGGLKTALYFFSATRDALRMLRIA